MNICHCKKCHPCNLIRPKTAKPFKEDRKLSVVICCFHTTVFFVNLLYLLSSATLDGGIGYILPVPEKVYRRMLMLQMKMNSGLPHCAGLNPKTFRMFHSRHQYLYNPHRSILDANLLGRYPQLSLKEKLDFAKQIGTSPRQVLDNLKEIDMITAHF